VPRPAAAPTENAPARSPGRACSWAPPRGLAGRMRRSLPTPSPEEKQRLPTPSGLHTDWSRARDAPSYPETSRAVSPLRARTRPRPSSGPYPGYPDFGPRAPAGSSPSRPRPVRSPSGAPPPRSERRFRDAGRAGPTPPVRPRSSPARGGRGPHPLGRRAAGDRALPDRTSPRAGCRRDSITTTARGTRLATAGREREAAEMAGDRSLAGPGVRRRDALGDRR
jgi:hypothetical protein